MNSTMLIMLNAFGGLLLGSFFYLGLYWTVKRGLTSKHPGLLFASSFFIRTAVVLFGILLLTRGIFSALVPCMAGLILSRLLVFIIDKKLAKPEQFNI